MKVVDLIKTLQKILAEDGNVDIDICQSQFDWDSVLYYIPDPMESDRSVEIRL